MGRIWIVAIMLSACGRVGFDPLVTDDPGGTDGSTVSCGAAPSCPGFTIPIAVGGQSNATTNPGNHGFAGSCGGNANPEAPFKLNPLGAGTYTFTITEGGPGLVVVRDGCCTGPELACGMGPVTVSLARGQPAFLFVESLAPSITVQIAGT